MGVLSSPKPFYSMQTVLLVFILVQISRLVGAGEYAYDIAGPPPVVHGSNVTINFQSVGLGSDDTLGQSPTDEVRLFCPPPPDRNNHSNYVDKWILQDVMTSFRNLSIGGGTAGTITVGPIINMRVPCQLNFYTLKTLFGFTTYTPVPPGTAIRFADRGWTPLQGHLSLTGNPSELRITWVSADVSDHAPSVFYRKTTEQDSDVSLVQAAAQTYAAGDMCGGIAAIVGPLNFRDPGNMYTAIMTGLQPSTEYVYWYGSTNSSFSVSPNRTVMSPQPITNTGSTTTCRLIAFADMGAWGGTHYDRKPWMSSAKSVIELVQNEWISKNQRVDLIAHVGDISYAMGKGYVWERFFYNIEPVATLVPYHVAIGNHEYDHKSHPSINDPSGVTASYAPSWGNFDDDSKGECGVPTNRRFHMPASAVGASPSSNGVFWYSHNVANVHMAVISTEHDLSPTSVQYAWLKHDLESVDRRAQPWVVVSGHRPMYNNENRDGTDDADLRVQMKLRDYLNQLFADNAVNLYICGHYHNYVRTGPINGAGQLAATGTVHVTVGTGGANLGSGRYKTFPWALKNLTTYGLLSVETAGSATMTLNFIDSAGMVLDQATLTQLARPTAAPTSTPGSGTTPPSITSTAPPKSGGSSNTAAIAAAVAMGVLLAVAIAIACIVWRRKQGRTSIDGRGHGPLPTMSPNDQEPLEEYFDEAHA